MVKDKYKELVIGQCFKNYRALQEFLGDEFKKSGKSKQLQLKDWKRFFTYIKEGQKFIITDVFEYPLSKEDHRGESANRSVYSKRIEVLILNMLQNTINGTLTIGRNDLYINLGLISEAYDYCHYDETNRKMLTDANDSIRPWHVNNFYRRCDSKIREIVNSALQSMKNRSLIDYFDVYLIHKDDRYFYADENQIKEILRAENEVLENMYYNVTVKIETITQVHLYGLADEFYETVGDILYQRHGWIDVYKQLKILSNKDRNAIALTRAEREAEQSSLNESLHEFINRNAETSYKRMIDKAWEKYKEESHNTYAKRDNLCWLDYKFYDIFYPSEDYVEAQKLLGDGLIPLDADVNDMLTPEEEDADTVTEEESTPTVSVIEHNTDHDTFYSDFNDADLLDIDGTFKSKGA